MAFYILLKLTALTFIVSIRLKSNAVMIEKRYQILEIEKKYNSFGIKIF